MNTPRHPDENLVFMGRVVASYSHEIQNILAIINESTGLMHDLLTLKKKDLADQVQRFAKTLEDVGEQVQRGQELSSHLNTLAHSPDKEVGGVDVVHSMQTIFALSNRLVKNKRMKLRLEEPQTQLQVTTRPVEFLHCLFCGLEWAMTHGEAGDEIVFQAQGTGDGVQITLSGWSLKTGTDDDGHVSRLQDVVSTLQGTCVLRGKELMITLPRQIEV